MVVNTYEKFCSAVNQSEIKKVEDMFASSDTRCSLISYYIEHYEKNTILSVFKSFQSRGLKENAIDICQNCSINSCVVKHRLLTKSNIKHYTCEENKKHNQIYHLYGTQKEL